MDLKESIRSIPDFPKPGILFYDISTLLADGDAWQVTMGRLARSVGQHHPDLLAGIESRGFPPTRPLARRIACPISMGQYQGPLVLDVEAPGKRVPP